MRDRSVAILCIERRKFIAFVSALDRLMLYAFEYKPMMYSMVFFVYKYLHLQLVAVKRFLLHYEQHFHRRALIKKFEYGQRGITKQKFKKAFIYTNIRSREIGSKVE